MKRHLYVFMQGRRFFRREFSNHVELTARLALYKWLCAVVGYRLAQQTHVDRCGLRFQDGRVMRTDHLNFVVEVLGLGEYTRYPAFLPRKEWTVVDAGACSGEFSVSCARAGARVFAFEPSDRCAATMSHNAREFGFTFVNKGLNDKAGPLYLGRQPIGLQRLDTKGQRIDCITLDDVYALVNAKKSANSPKRVDTRAAHVDLFKLDIEGAEIPVLSASKAFLKHCDRIVMEVHNGNDKDCAHLLEGRGFAVRQIGPILFASKNPADLS